ncbi:MAG: hypothetical protein M3217_04005 [Actinomycetota bacterium]|nr:hypothetical protein [Actinomycetota bacterium]
MVARIAVLDVDEVGSLIAAGCVGFRRPATRPVLILNVVVAIPAEHGVVTGSAEDVVVIRLALDEITTLFPVGVILTVAGTDGVVPCPGPKVVAAVVPEDLFATGSSEDAVAAAGVVVCTNALRPPERNCGSAHRDRFGGTKSHLSGQRPRPHNSYEVNKRSYCASTDASGAASLHPAGGLAQDLWVALAVTSANAFGGR